MVRLCCDDLASMHLQTPRIPLPPAFKDDWKLQDGQPVTRELYDTMVGMITHMNNAIDTLPELALEEALPMFKS